MVERGKYIVIEGVDGTGKSMQAAWLHNRLARSGIPIAPFLVEEPDGAVRIDYPGEVLLLDKLTDSEREERSLVPSATALRKIVKSKAMGLTPEANQLVFSAARVMNWTQAINPALERGDSVTTARNYWSTLVYNCIAEGKPTDDIEALTHLMLGERYTNPDFGIILDIEDEDGRLERLSSRDDKSTLDAFESRGEEFQRSIRMGYLAVGAAKNIPILSIKSTDQPEHVHNIIVDLINERGLFPQKIRHTPTREY